MHSVHSMPVKGKAFGHARHDGKKVLRTHGYSGHNINGDSILLPTYRLLLVPKMVC